MSKLRELEKRLRDEPDNLGLRVALAGAFVEANRRGDAVELYRSVAIAYREQGRTQQAIAVCRSVLELAPDDASCQALLAAMMVTARPPTEPPPAAEVVARPPPEPPPLLPPEPDDDDEAGVERLSLADLLRASRPSTSDITPLPTPVPYEVADPTIPPEQLPAGMRPVPKLTHHDLPPSMRAHMPDELAQAAKLEGIAAAAHQISASLLAVRNPDDDEPGHDDAAPRAIDDPDDLDDPDDEPEETGERIDDDDLIDAGEGTGVAEITIANDLDVDDGPPDIQTHRMPRLTDSHTALDRLGTLRPTMPLSPAARRAAGMAELGAPKRPSVSRITAVDDEKTKPREMPRQLRPPTAPSGPAVEAFDSALFQALPGGQRPAVLDRFRHRLASVGTTVIRRGESGHGLVLVVRGRLDVHSERADGARVSLEAIGAGDYIGEISLLARAPAPAYVVAAVDCELLVLSADEFYELVAAFPGLRAEVRTTAERRIRAHDQLLRM